MTEEEQMKTLPISREGSREPGAVDDREIIRLSGIVGLLLFLHLTIRVSLHLPVRIRLHLDIASAVVRSGAILGRVVRITVDRPIVVHHVGIPLNFYVA